jgi:BirA family transcriptional regulator, biotin operon repressor / biotin---[acetyl-CoA-carboxylase] ligase
MMRTEDDTPGQGAPDIPGPVTPDAPRRPAPADRAVPADRAALDGAVLRRAVVRPGGLWRAVEVLASTGSTNADLLAWAASGAPEGVVLAAEEQTAGRGRMGRSWVSPPRAALTFSLLVRPDTVSPARRGWLPLLSGVSVASALRAAASVDARLKWPNDVLVGPAKLGGILAEATGDAVVVGIGLNVSTEPGELPPPGPAPGGALPATSLRVLAAEGLAAEGPAAEGPAAEGPAAAGNGDRERLLTEILAAFEHWYQAWRQAGGDPDRCGLRAEYTRLCATIGRRVRVELPGGQLLSGLAAGVDPDGRLLVRVSSAAGLPDTEVPVAAGDVVHLR